MIIVLVCILILDGISFAFCWINLSQTPSVFLLLVFEVNLNTLKKNRFFILWVGKKKFYISTLFYKIFFLQCFTLFLETVQTITKHVIHLVDIQRAGVWEQRGTYLYYTEFVTDTLILAATLGHYIQILWLHGISFTLIDAVLFLHMKTVFTNLKDKITAYRNYRKLAENLKTSYPDVPEQELAERNEMCPICWDKLLNAKKLPCGHMFHQ